MEPWPSFIDFCPWIDVRHVITVARGKGYFATRSIYYSNSTSSFHQMRLFIGGDISLNPGPDKCHYRLKTISRKHRALNCSDCEKRYLVKCCGANPNQLGIIQPTNWICNAFLLRNLPFSDDITLNISLECEQHELFECGRSR